MPFNYNSLRSEALNTLQKPYASPAYFDVYLSNPPSCMTNNGLLSDDFFGTDANGVPLHSTLTKAVNLGADIVSNILFSDPSQIRFRVKAIDLPQRQLETQPRFTAGPQRLVPYGAVYSTCNMELIESDQYKIRSFFEKWHDKVYSANNAYQVTYYSEMIVDNLTIVAYAANGIPVRVWKLTEAFPIAINSSQMSWDAQNQYLVINIEMAFHEWTSDTPNLMEYGDTALAVGAGFVKSKIADII